MKSQEVESPLTTLLKTYKKNGHYSCIKLNIIIAMTMVPSTENALPG